MSATTEATKLVLVERRDAVLTITIAEKRAPIWRGR
jgi:hypothetical protein